MSTLCVGVGRGERTAKASSFFKLNLAFSFPFSLSVLRPFVRHVSCWTQTHLSREKPAPWTRGQEFWPPRRTCRDVQCQDETQTGKGKEKVWIPPHALLASVYFRCFSNRRKTRGAEQLSGIPESSRRTHRGIQDGDWRIMYMLISKALINKSSLKGRQKSDFSFFFFRDEAKKGMKRKLPVMEHSSTTDFSGPLPTKRTKKARHNKKKTAKNR